MEKFGLIGEKLSHSYSPVIHSHFGSYPYNLLEVEPQNLKSLIQNPAYKGFNVTIPYKKEVLSLCDWLSPEALAIGSVNTLVKSQGKIKGYNTDYYGFMYLLKRAGLSPKGLKSLVLGSGGASLTVQKALEDLGAKEVIVISRQGENNYQNISNHFDAQFIVNTTPVGMYPNGGEAPISIQNFSHCIGVVDLIYNPHRTKLVLDALTLGIPGVGGLDMLVAQAKKAAELFLNTAIDNKKTDQVIKAIEKDRLNLVLIGMPGSGKTTFGRQLAKELRKTFVDIDYEIERRQNLSIPAIFALYGEGHFRRLETALLAQYGCQSGLVIATGGGVVTQSNNYPIIKQNSHVVWVKRNIEELELKGRPLSTNKEAVQHLYCQRKNLYLNWCDSVIENGIMALP